MTAAPAHEPLGKHQSKKAAASGWIGSALEYYDFFIYATAAALIFPQIFFPKGDPKTAIIASLATYGVGYIARPIGAFVLGHLGDTHGRKNVLLWCMFLMGFSTIAVGLLPTYDQVGLWAPTLLVIMRLIQGFAVAGEISGASSMILEHAPFGRRGFFASFTLQGVQAGQILAAAVFLPLAHYMPADQFNSWGWRIPFLLSFVVIIAGYVIRREVHETPAFTAEQQQQGRPRSPVIDAFKYSTPDMLRVVCMALMNVIPVVATIFGAAYAVQPAYGIGFAKDIYLWIPVVGNIVAVLVIPYVGDLSDRIGRRNSMLLFGALSVLGTVPLMKALATVTTPLAAFGLITVALAIVSFYTSISGLIKAEMFPPEVRAMGVGLSYAIANAVFGGSAEYVALWFKQAGTESTFYWYVTALCAVSFVVTYFMPDPSKEGYLRHTP